jgi:hypothetical protein
MIRCIQAAVFVTIQSTAIAGFADDRMPAASDAYYACLVGQGAVELQYRNDAQEALTIAIDACESLRVSAAEAHDEGSDFVQGNAWVALQKISGEAV